MGTLCMLNETGHGTITWKEGETLEAKNLFNELKAKGWFAFQTFPGREKNAQQLFNFDPEAENIVMTPPFVGG
jgi:hypothetical protein